MISRYDPFREALSLRRAMDQLFEQSFVNPNMMAGSQTMLAPMDVCETPNGYEVDVALPGVRPEDIELTVDQNTVTIRGRYSHQNEKQNQPQGQTQDQTSQQQSQSQTQPRGKSSPARLNGASPSPGPSIPTMSKRNSRMGSSRLCFLSVKRANRSASPSQVTRVNRSRCPSEQEQEGDSHNKGKSGLLVRGGGESSTACSILPHPS